MRDRATDLIAEEDDLARTLASTWARDPDKTFPRLHAEPDVLLSAAGSFWSIDSTPDSPDTPFVEAMGWGPVVGDGSGLTDRLQQLLTEGYRVVVAADGDGSARRLKSLLLDQGLDFVLVSGHLDELPPGGSIVVAPLFFLSLLHPFKRPEIAHFRWCILSMWLFGVMGMTIYGIPEGILDPNQI